MAKFTIFFKENPIHTYVFEAGVIYIGRDSTNMIVIDNLSIAPIHAIAVIREQDCLIKQINDNFPLIINGTAHKEYCLTDQDKIILGKHEILYNVNSYSKEQTIRTDFKNFAQDVNTVNLQPEKAEANLQIMDGKHIGRIIPVKKDVTRIGNSQGGMVIITKNKTGYVISPVENGSKLMLNNALLTQPMVTLSHNDIIRIDDISMQFFLG